MAFYYDQISGKLGIAQYSQYLENEMYIRQLKSISSDAVNYQLVEIRRHLQTFSPEARDNFDQLSSKVCGTLENGFRSITSEISETNTLLEKSNWILNEIDEGINRIYSMLDWKTDIIIEEQRISNFYLGKVVKLLKIPDSQKQRAYYVEQGLSFLKNAILEGPKSEFYSDALDDFHKAYEIESKDYFVLQKLGVIYFNSTRHLDAVKAESFFRSSARYAKAAANSYSEGSQTSLKSSNEIIMSRNSLLAEYAAALNYASRCCYVLNKKEDAIALAKEAFDSNSENPEYGFQLAKAYAANNNVHEANSTISKIIDIDKNYFIKVLTDPDFIRSKEIVLFLEAKATKYIEMLESVFLNLSEKLTEDGNAKYFVEKIKPLLKSGNYINARLAMDTINRNQQYAALEYTYDDFYLRHRMGNKFFTSGIKEHRRQYNITLSELVELEYKSFFWKQEYEKLDIKQRESAHGVARRQETALIIKRVILIVLPLVLITIIYNISKLLAFAILVIGIFLIVQFWKKK